MKKYLALCGFVGVAALLISWGAVGHRTVALIAERHLNSQAKAAVHELLGNQSLADVANWADEVRNETEYKQTAPLHFLNEPLGLSEAQFAKDVEYNGANSV